MKVAGFSRSPYNESMFKLRELVKECIDQQKTDNPTSSEEDLFDVVMEDIMSMVLDYTFWDYEMDEE